MLHSLHYDVAYFTPGNKRHPGSHTEHCFTALTQRGLEQLKTVPCGELRDGRLIVIEEAEATEIMDHIEALEVYLFH